MFRLLIAGIFAITAFATSASAAELVMFEQRGCIWCEAWDREIGPAYANTEEGKRAPLRRVDIQQEIPVDISYIPVERFTPTFVLVDDGKEIGRIRGYPGDEFFWFLLSDMLSKLDDKAS
ncbi:transcriptional regulator [Oricola cellulosilytica]|uniref:Transcriptional regulator n=1 Tax=Oricola cellulosilytica TaxID=1429082 RepID=A0A4R0P5S4_9HYPH|nr:transcriptional regulator [Oricola cellulosilytica]TCD11957.1 transcriptional regulator [Oricola cellulosilytica]